ncbi:MOFRL family protein [Polynucleobacter sinensis]|uniref:MOFRL family protein n=1 Tax=Polynucleobacter sinensis TaxID=1743157 RepID=UPI000B1CA665|nr:MOFRL family protein [Polynucleobacter sinensis]
MTTPSPVVLTTAEKSLEAAKAFALSKNIGSEIFSDCIEGEAQEVGAVFGAMAKWISKKNTVLKKPVVLLSGGETTVTVKGNGRGGRNTEFLLSFANVANGANGIYAIAADTDGIDGSEDNAGATYSPETIRKGIDAGVDLASHLNANDAYSYFSVTGDLLVTGPTRTNVNDFRAILII